MHNTAGGVGYTLVAWMFSDTQSAAPSRGANTYTDRSTGVASGSSAACARRNGMPSTRSRPKVPAAWREPGAGSGRSSSSPGRTADQASSMLAGAPGPEYCDARSRQKASWRRRDARWAWKAVTGAGLLRLICTRKVEGGSGQSFFNVDHAPPKSIVFFLSRAQPPDSPSAGRPRAESRDTPPRAVV